MNIDELGQKIDSALDNKNASELINCISVGEQLIKENKRNPANKSILYYYIGNAWSNLDQIKHRGNEKEWYFNRIEHLNAIKYYRSLINLKNDKINKKILVRTYTNLGNMFKEAGRFIRAIEYYNCALGINREFGMALGNKGDCLVYYSKCSYNKCHINLLAHEAYSNLNLALLDKNLFPESIEFFNANLKMIKNFFGLEFLNQKACFKEVSLGDSDEEIEYRKWCMKNSLFLNPLNDIYTNSFITEDILSLPSIRIRGKFAPIYHGFFNEIKQCYISLRYFYYLSDIKLNDFEKHFSDSKRHLVNTLDYPQYGLKYEYLTMSFKMAYSIFDKIAFFLNKYLNLGIPLNKISYKKIWFNSEGEIRGELQKQNNLALKALYFLSKDFFDKEYMRTIETDLKGIKNLRNNIEHRYFKIQWMNVLKKKDTFYDNFAHTIIDKEFYGKTLRIIKSAREALIYLSLAIHLQERKLEDDDRLVGEFPLSEFD